MQAALSKCCLKYFIGKFEIFTLQVLIKAFTLYKIHSFHHKHDFLLCVSVGLLNNADSVSVQSQLSLLSRWQYRYMDTIMAVI